MKVKYHRNLIRTPNVDRGADARPRNSVKCVNQTWTSPRAELEPRGTVIWRDLSSTGQRHHVDLQYFSDVVVQSCRGAARRSSCCVPADWCRESSTWIDSPFISIPDIRHATRQRHVLSFYYWRTCNYSTRRLRIWNIAIHIPLSLKEHKCKLCR